ncbi:trypsin-like peptidase domain-containing protein [Micromonospora sp. DT233]|uniref:trypsin-like peptidase domain-containing protein n=1 Tax=Micromonospora sp. DT233 TaxID=3393432 RepID=UPI003CF4C00F
MHDSRFAVGELRVFQEQERFSGTAFAVSTTQALTAFHCVGDRKTGDIIHERVAISFGGKEISARVVRYNATLDVALLDLLDPLPGNLRPVPLALTLARHDRFVAVGWPVSRPFPHDASSMSGSIVEIEATIFDGVSAIQLYSEQAGVGTQLDGYSGSPLLVSTGKGEAAGGLIRCCPTSDLDTGQADGGTVYATSISSVVNIWADLGACLLDAAIVTSADCAVSYATNSFDTDWGLWIAQSLANDERRVFIRDWYLRPGDFYLETLQAGFAKVHQVFVIISTASLRDDSDLYLAESRIVQRHEYARRIPVLLDDVSIPAYLQTRHPLRLYNLLDEEEACKAMILGALRPPGRPPADQPFPGRSKSVGQHTTWLSAGPQDLGRRDDGA